MPGEKSQNKGAKIFLGVILLFGGFISILIPASNLEGSSITIIILGITFVVLGTTFIWEATKRYRKRNKKDS